MKRRPLSLSKAFNDVSHHPARCFEIANNLRGIAGHYKIPRGMTAFALETRTAARMAAAVRSEAQEKNISEAQRKNSEAGYLWDLIKTMKSPAFLLRSWNELVSLNPGLVHVRMNKRSSEDLYNAHRAVTSGFNVDDINFFIEQTHVGKGYPAQQAQEMPDHGDRIARIDSVSAVPVQWVLSPKPHRKSKAA